MGGVINRSKKKNSNLLDEPQKHLIAVNLHVEEERIEPLPKSNEKSDN